MKSEPVFHRSAADQSVNKGRPILAVLALGGLALFAYPQEPEPQRGRKAPADPKISSVSRDRLMARPRPASPAPERLPVGEEIRTSAGQRRRVRLDDGSVLYAEQHTTVKHSEPRQLQLSAGEIFVEVPPGQDGASEKLLVVHAAGKQISGQAARFGVRITSAGVGVIVTQGQVGVNGLVGLVRAGQQLVPGVMQTTSGPPVAQALAWTRDLMTAAEAPLVPASKYTGGALVAFDPDGQQARLSLRRFHIDVHIEDGFARTTIDQTYFNHESWRLEGTFYFPLPPDASLSRLAMYVDGKLMEGGMAERDYARQVFETIVTRQKDPALLEWVDGSTFKMRVFPLEARQEKRIILSYTQRLPVHRALAEYRFPAGHSLETVRDWSFHARLKNEAATAWTCTSHPLKATPDGADLLLDAAAQNVKPDRDLVLSFADGKSPAPADEPARFSAVEHDGAKYLMLRYRPFLAARGERPRRDWVFLFESSGDRDPLLARTQIEVIRSILANAEPDDTFAVLAAGTRVQIFAAELRPVTLANVQAAIAFLEGVHLIGALDLDKALTEAGRFLRTARSQPCLVHVGGGNVTLGERREDVLAKRLAGGTRYVGVGVGKRWAAGVMKTLAERTEGYFTQINPNEPISWRTFELVGALGAPRLLNIRVTDEAGAVVFLPYTRSVGQGEELCAVTRLDPGQAALPHSVTITGVLEGKPFRRVLPVANVAENAAYLPRTWARLEIDRLLAENGTKNRPQIVALSKAMYVMTPFTSLLVLENEQMYAQYKVDRGRKDHWAMYPCPEQIPVVQEQLPGRPTDTAGGERRMAPALRAPNQVLQTVLVRGSASVLTEPTDSLPLAADAGPLARGSNWSRARTKRPPGWASGGTPDIQEQVAQLMPIPSFSPRGFQGGLTGLGLVGGNLAGFGGGFAGVGGLGIGGLGIGGLGPAGGAALGRPAIAAGAAVGAAVDNESRGVRPAMAPGGLDNLPGALTGSGLGAGESRSAGRELREILAEPVSFELEQGPLQKALDLIRDRYNVAILVNEEAFKNDLQMPDVRDQVVNLEKMTNIPLSVVLRALLAQVQGTYVVRSDFIEVTTPQQAAAESASRLFPRRGFANLLGQGSNPEIEGEEVAGPTGLSLGWQLHAAGLPALPSDSQDPLDDLRAGRVQRGAIAADAGNRPGWFGCTDCKQLLVRLAAADHAPSLLYRRPRLVEGDDLFRDLLLYTPAMHTSRADLLGVLHAEAQPNPPQWPGRIDPRARGLIERARAVGWQTIAIPDGAGKTPLTVVCDGAGRYAFERVLPWGLRERVVYDGQTLRHFYPELAVGASRRVSRFHRADFTRLVPWALLPAEDLAHGADVVGVGPQTVAIIPLGKEPVHTRIELTFAADGRLAERRLVEMPAAKVRLRETYSAAGEVRQLDGRQREVSVRHLTVSTARPPDLNPDDKDLVVLPFPPRVLEDRLRLPWAEWTRSIKKLEVEPLLALASEEVAQGQRGQALEFLAHRVQGEGRRLRGVGVLWAAGQTSDLREPENPPGWVEFGGDPLDRYLRSLREPELQRRVKLPRTAEAGNGLLQRLLDLHILRNRLTSEAARARGPAQRQADREWALKYVRQNRSSPLGWAMLTILQEEGGGDEDFRGAVARTSKLFEDVPVLGYAARYEQARGLLKTGRRSQAAKRFRELYAQTLDEGQLPRIDRSFREALRAEGQGPDRWAAWVRQTAAILAANRRRPEVVALAWQCWDLGDQALANRLLADLLDRSAGKDQRREVSLTALEFLCQTYQYDQADWLFRSLETEAAFAQDPAFWRLGTMLAPQRQHPARMRSCLEQALEREYQQAPEVFDLRAVRNDYGLLLRCYQQTASAMATLEVEPPAKFVDQVVRTADRWRALDPDEASACWMAGWVLQTVGARDLAWDYLTTALSRPAAAVRLWPDLVNAGRAAGDRELAVRACAAAFDAEPTNPWVLCEWAAILQEMGRPDEARRILRRLAEGSWPPDADPAQKLAREYLEGR